MQKEDLIKRLRLFVTLTTVAFVFLAVVLLMQFGFIAYYNNQMQSLREENARIEKAIEDLKKEGAYYGDGGEGEHDAGMKQ